MPGKPNQFQLSFDAGQDRMLLRINTDDKSEYRLWLTRRIVRALWKGLLQVLEAAPETGEPDGAGKRDAILHFDHQAAVEQSDFKTPFEDAARSYPLGEDGILVASIELSAKTSGAFTMKLNPVDGSGINMNLNQQLLHTLMQMLIDSSNNTEWDLQLKLPVTDSGLPADLPRSGNQVRH